MASLGGVDICRQHDIRAYPTVLTYQRGERKEELAKTPESLLEDVQKLVGAPSSESPFTTESVSVDDSVSLESPKVEAQHVHPFPLVQDPAALVEDAALTMFRLLKNEVFKGNMETLSVSEMRDLEHLLSICNQSLLPVSSREACAALNGEISNLRRAGKELTRPAWLALVDAEMDAPKHFLTCKDFSCGMWRLLHLITLSSRQSDHPEGFQTITAEKSMEATRFIVDKYFSCEVCKNHFLSHYDSCDFGRCSMVMDSLNVAAWLSRLHNGVNARLNKLIWPHGLALSDATVTVNELRSQYGLTPILAPSVWRPMAWLTVAFLLVVAVACVRFISGRSTMLNRIKFSLTKKYHPIDIV
jgi:hypothetical protein